MNDGGEFLLGPVDRNGWQPLHLHSARRLAIRSRRTASALAASAATDWRCDLDVVL